MSFYVEQPAAMGIHYLYYHLGRMLALQKAAGYRSIELWGGAPHVLLTPEGVGKLEEVRREVRESGMRVVCVTPENCSYPWQFAARSPALAAASRAYFYNGLRLASELECPLMAVNSGWGLADEPREEAMKRSLDMIAWLADQAGPLGVTRVMESLRPEESNLVNSLPGTAEFLKTLGHANLRPMVDTCAMAVAGETLEDWFAAFPGAIAHMHFVDGTPYGQLAWGDGDRSLPDYLAVLEKNNYTGALTQELTDGRYFSDPQSADRKNMMAFRPYFRE